MAYVLIEALRRIALPTTRLGQATAGTIRLRLLKIGALVRRLGATGHGRHGLRPPLAAATGPSPIKLSPRRRADDPDSA